ncbi:GMC oxidoreductase [Poseidonocella sp. HB161398]|uniref:GMC oxidoreductase n=1 Tax=Poseidonocella sp. HB161398 TaxID=2320855 RepID=UPI001F0DA61A|nr:GMC oxidoreductase [Poseidonocella sp. HB161398]
MSSNVVSCGGFADVSGAGLPDIQFHVLPVLTGWVDRPAPDCHGIAIEPNFLRPKSRGSVHLRSADFRDKALFDVGSFRDSDDLEVLVRGLETAIQILGTRPLADLVARRHLPEPGLEREPDALRDFVRQTAKTVYHPVATARMGPDGDAMAVLTGDLKVRGTEGQRVADASAMPLLVSGNTNAPTMMIAERAARFILGRKAAA